MNFRSKFRFCPAINERLSEEVIPHKTRDNTVVPTFQNGRQRAAIYTVNEIAFCLSHACIF